jgi:hypothetical protein
VGISALRFTSARQLSQDLAGFGVRT